MSVCKGTCGRTKQVTATFEKSNRELSKLIGRVINNFDLLFHYPKSLRKTEISKFTDEIFFFTS